MKRKIPSFLPKNSYAAKIFESDINIFGQYLFFDWRKFFRNKAPKANSRVWYNAYIAAKEWPTCSCGFQHKEIDRTWWSDAPIDRVLYRNGIKFADAIKQKNFKRAKILMKQIDKRAKFLLSKIYD